jgi:Transglutaminase-like superfamily
VKTLARILRTPPADLFLLAEAFLLMTAARIALRKIPLERIVKWLERPMPSKASPNAGETALRVQWAIRAVVRRMPSAFVCFPQSLAAYAMLRRRGVAGVLNYGVNRSPENELRAHTWLNVGNFTVVGGESAPEFTLLRTFP